MNTDPIADLLTRLRNASAAGLEQLSLPASKLKIRIAEILEKQGYIAGHEVVAGEPRSSLRIQLKYEANRRPVLHGLRRVSKPGLRVYSRGRQIPRVLGGVGIAIVSTSKGVMTGGEAYSRHLGGELLCFVW